MKKQVLALCAILIINSTSAKPEGYYRQHYQFEQQSSSYRNNELQHKKEESGKVTKFGDLDGSVPPQERSSYRQSEYRAPEAADIDKSQTRLSLTDGPQNHERHQQLSSYRREWNQQNENNPTRAHLSYGSGLAGSGSTVHQSSFDFGNSGQTYQTGQEFGHSRPMSQSLTSATTGSNILGTGSTSQALSGTQSQSYSYGTQSSGQYRTTGTTQSDRSHIGTGNNYRVRSYEPGILVRGVPVVAVTSQNMKSEPETIPTSFRKEWRTESSYSYGTDGSNQGLGQKSHLRPHSENLQSQSHVIDSTGTNSRTFQTVSEQNEEKQTRYTNVYQHKPVETGKINEKNEDLTQTQHIVHVNELNEPGKPRIRIQGRERDHVIDNNEDYGQNKNRGNIYPVTRVLYTDNNGNANIPVSASVEKQSFISSSQNQLSNAGDVIKIKVTPQNTGTDSVTRTSYTVTQSKISGTKVPQIDSLQTNNNYNSTNSRNIRYIARVQPKITYQQSEPELEPEGPKVINNERLVKSFEKTSILNSEQEQQKPRSNIDDQTTHHTRTMHQSSGYTRTHSLSNIQPQANVDFDKQEPQIHLKPEEDTFDSSRRRIFASQQHHSHQIPINVEPQNQQNENHFTEHTQRRYKVQRTEKTEFSEPREFVSQQNGQVLQKDDLSQNSQTLRSLNLQRGIHNFDINHQQGEDLTQQYQNKFDNYNAPQQDLSQQTNSRTYNIHSSSQHQQNLEKIESNPQRTNLKKLEFVNQKPDNDYEELEFGQKHEDISRQTNNFETLNRQGNIHNNNQGASYSSSHSYSNSKSYSTQHQPQITVSPKRSNEYSGQLQYYETLHMPPGTTRQEMEEKLKQRLQEKMHELQLQQQRKIDEYSQRNSQQMITQTHSTSGALDFGTGCDDQNEGSFSSSHSSGSYGGIH